MRECLPHRGRLWYSRWCFPSCHYSSRTRCLFWIAEDTRWSLSL